MTLEKARLTCWRTLAFKSGTAWCWKQCDHLSGKTGTVTEKYCQGKLFVVNFTSGATVVFSSRVCMMWITATRRGVPGNFTVAGEWSPCERLLYFSSRIIIIIVILLVVQLSYYRCSCCLYHESYYHNMTLMKCDVCCRKNRYESEPGLDQCKWTVYCL